MNSSNKLISVKGRERPLTKKQRHIFLSLSKHAFDFSQFKGMDCLEKNKIFLEIGFGAGEIIFEEAKKNHNNIYVGIEYYKRGVAQLIKKIEDHNLKNIKIFHGDAHKFLEKLSGVFLMRFGCFFLILGQKKGMRKEGLSKKSL